MTGGYVLDTETIVAYLYDEPGSDDVRRIVEGASAGERDVWLARTNASEVLYLVARFEGVDGVPTQESLRVADRDVRAIERAGVTIAPADWRTVGEVKAHGSISLTDASAVALAEEHEATLLVGADDDFDDLPLDVPIERIRSDAA